MFKAHLSESLHGGIKKMLAGAYPLIFLRPKAEYTLNASPLLYRPIRIVVITINH